MSADIGIDRPERPGAQHGDGTIRAAIDLGTNSFHLLVARVDPSGAFDVLAKEKDVVRLGSGSGDMSELTDAAMERGIDALSRFRKIADSYGATVHAVATSALREAANRRDFLDRAHDVAGIDIDVVSGAEEARLIHLGVLQAVPLYDEPILVVDIGGGSTEFVVGHGSDVHLARSTKLGAIRLTDRFFPGGHVRNKMVKECRTYVRSFLVPTMREVAPLRPFAAVGSSGTIVTIARMVAGLEGRDPNAAMNGTAFSRDGLDEVVDLLIAARDPEDRASIPGLDERRRDIIVAGALLLQGIVHRLDIAEMRVSEGALREGILLDRASSSPEPAFHHLSDIRRQSVLRMADRYHEDAAHIERATDLSLELFDALSPLHGYGLTERDYLEAAGLLHNVGLFISHAAHHKHSYYVIRNSDQLSGFSEDEIELIAQIARYHRKSAPKPSHEEFQRLRSRSQALIKMLAGMLRIGIALDRTRQSAVRGIEVTMPETSKDAVVVTVQCDDDCDISLELYTATQRTDLLESAIGHELDLRFVSATPVP